MKNDFDARIEALLKRESRYTAEAYRFVSEAVSFTVGRLTEHRHVSAAELLAGCVDYSRREYGPLRELVLRSWGLESGSDVGVVVYLLIGEKILSASPGDAPEDFDIDFEFFDPPVVLKRKRRAVGLPYLDLPETGGRRQ